MKIPAATLSLVLLSFAAAAQANVNYQLDSGSATIFFNNTATTETEDNWVANSFTTVAGGTQLNSITFYASALNAQEISASIYKASSLTDPTSLSLISTTTTTLTAGGGWDTISFTTPVDLAVGQIFYAALLLPQVPGNVFPFSEDTGSTVALGRSFFDVGPTPGGAYDLNNTANATVLGGNHPVIGPEEQYPGNLLLRVNADAATTTPEPGFMIPLAVGAIVLFGTTAIRRRAGA